MSVLIRTFSARSSWIRPMEVLIRQSPSGPSATKSDIGDSACTSEPAGSSTVISTEPFRLEKTVRCLGPLRVSRPPEKSIWVNSAALMSASLVALVGRTSTTASVRLLARIHTEPISKSRATEIGPSVSYVGMAVPSSWLVWVFPLVGAGVALQGQMVGGAEVSVARRCQGRGGVSGAKKGVSGPSP